MLLNIFQLKSVGEVSLTCDVWQALNVDVYFVVTGHWIEEIAPGIWEQHAALFGFMRMNTAHNGVHLGRALFGVIQQLGIPSKVTSFQLVFVILMFYLRLAG